jgi:hypothetical protein
MAGSVPSFATKSEEAHEYTFRILGPNVYNQVSRQMNTIKGWYRSGNLIADSRFEHDTSGCKVLNLSSELKGGPRNSASVD